MTAASHHYTHPEQERRPLSTTGPLPYLTLSELRSSSVLGPQELTIDEELVAAYDAVSGSDYAGEVPPGLLGVLARRAYLAHHDMPPGGVMLGQDLIFHRPLPLGRPVELLAEVEEVGERKGRPYVRIRSVVRDGGQVLAETVTHALWPEEVAA